MTRMLNRSSQVTLIRIIRLIARQTRQTWTLIPLVGPLNPKNNLQYVVYVSFNPKVNLKNKILYYLIYKPLTSPKLKVRWTHRTVFGGSIAPICEEYFVIVGFVFNFGKLLIWHKFNYFMHSYFRESFVITKIL